MLREKPVNRALANSLLSLLLAATLLWGGCISCEQYFMVKGSKDCCNPDGHCKTKNPVKGSVDRECKQIAFDHQKSIDLHVDLPVVAILTIEPLGLEISTLQPSYEARPVDTSPPDLQLLHSTFLI
jgi:hypothetical protein